jgi:hypothetical protein
VRLILSLTKLISEIKHLKESTASKTFLSALLSYFTTVCMELEHRDKTRVQMPAKVFPHLKLLCWLFMDPTRGINTKQRNSFLIKFGGFFYNKNKIMTILFIVKYEKITLFDEFLVLLGPIISWFLHVQMRGKNKQKQQRVLALVLSL